MLDLSQYNLVRGNLSRLIHRDRDKNLISAFGMQFADRCFAAALMDRAVMVCADFVTAKNAFDLLKCLRERVVYLPARDDVLTYSRASLSDNDILRSVALGKIADGSAEIIVTTSHALQQLYPHRVDVLEHTISFSIGLDEDRDVIAARLASSNYRRVSSIDGVGQFAVRGDILDISPIGSEYAVRIEFFGDQVESVRKLDTGTQRSMGNLEQVVVYPNTEVFYSDGETLIQAVRKDAELKSDADVATRRSSIVDDVCSRLAAGASDRSLSFIMPLIDHESLFDFIGEGYVYLYDECKQISDNAAMHMSEHVNRFRSLLLAGEALPCSMQQLTDTLYDGRSDAIAFHKITTQNRIFTPNEVLKFDSTALMNYSRNYQSLIDDVRIWAYDYQIVLCCGNEALAGKMHELMLRENIPMLHGDKGISIVADYLVHGAIFHEQKIIFIGTGDITSGTQKKVLRRAKKDVFVQPEVGDYVVHNVHGIGVCEEIRTMTMNSATRDYVVIRYRDGDKLFVPIENMDSLSKYVATGEAPKLSKIGGDDFAKVKDKVRKSVKALAFDLVKLYAERKSLKGHRYSADNAELHEFERAFPHAETEDQLSAIEAAVKDLTDGKIMDRLLCGDVGYGKTEVALRVAYKVILEGKQVAFVSPTTILAKQHFNTAVERMAPFGVNVVSLTRFENVAQTKDVLEKLRSGKADIVVGTHRVLGKDVVYKDLGLLILDEEQRFGVADKEKIKLIKNDVNVLTLSATPIPRTLNMSMIGVRDMSVLDTPPAERIPVQTYVSEYNDNLIRDAVMRELGRGGQVFVVYNRVENIESFAARLKSIMPEVRFAIAHGQMPESRLERTIEDFVGGKADVLVASTIIENGIDMPNTNTLVVIDSDRMGLSQLYQLRGRIGRSNRLAYAFFTYNGDKPLSEVAYKRLEAITQYTDFGSGFKIAMRDLELRGVGNILGREQHGHMEKVGYDMYCKILAEAVAEAGGAKSEVRREVKVSIDCAAYVPEGYIADSKLKLRVYARIAEIDSIMRYDRLLLDLKDMFGYLPQPVVELARVALVKNLAARSGATEVIFKPKSCVVIYGSVADMDGKIVDKVNSVPYAQLDLSSKPSIVFTSSGDKRLILIKFLANL